MGFSNGTEGELFMSKFCYKCKNWKKRGKSDMQSCPIIDAHLFYGYNAKDDAKTILAMFIPHNADSCAMLIPIGASGQVRL